MSDHIVGIDEVGRGSLVGSAVVCAFRSDDKFFQSLPFEVIDSKKISQKKREMIYDFFTSNKSLNFSYKIVIAKKRKLNKKIFIRLFWTPWLRLLLEYQKCLIE